MPKIVNTSIIIDGTDFLPKSGYRVSISHKAGHHSKFNVVFQTSAIEGYAGTLMDRSLDYVGKKITIVVDDGEMGFNGLITSVDLQKTNGAAGIIIISGYGGSILLSKSVQCCSYDEGSSFAQVVSDTVNGHSTNILKTSIGNGTDIKLPYTVQYNESDFSFLQRMCARYGVWLYDNGKELCIGRIGDKQVDGVYGENIQTFNLATALQEQNFGLKTHDWVNNMPLEGDSSTNSPQASHAYMGIVKGESDTVFSKKGAYDWPHDQAEYSGQQGTDRATKINTLGKAAGLIVASGTSELVDLRVGDTLSVQGLNFSDSTRKESYGSYMITKLVHHFDHTGNYSNDFEGVPDATEHPPYSNIFAVPICGSQRGLVFDNADPEGLGRIKVQFGWQQAMGTTTPWIKMATPYSGSEKGFYFIPEIEEEVLVGFEGNDPERPYIQSAGFNKTANSTFADPDNNIKAIKTRSGHLIQFNDTDGEESITITDKNSNKILLNTKDSSISITAPNNLSLTADTIDIKAKNALTMKSEEATIVIDAKESIDLESLASNIDIAAKNSLKMKAEQNVQLESELSEVNITAKTDVNIEGTASTNVDSDIVNILGGSKIKVESSDTDIF